MTNKKIKTHSDYTKFSSGYQLSLALDFAILIQKNELVRLLNEILEELDYTMLEAAYHFIQDSSLFLHETCL